MQDAPTPPTTRTEARCLRIDYLLYQATKLRLLSVGAIPTLERPMPNEEMPSDHAPVSARFAFRSPHSQLEADARQWLNAMNGGTSVRPLNRVELRRAFSFFDKDGSGVITAIELESAISLLGYPNLTARRVREMVHASCEPGDVPCQARVVEMSDAEIPQAFGFDEFAKAFCMRAFELESENLLQLRMAFDAFDRDRDGVLTIDEFVTAIRKVSPTKIDDVTMEGIVTQLDVDGDGLITIDEWVDFCQRNVEQVIA